jgi:hypothetical protein
MNRRGFLAALATGIVGAAVDVGAPAPATFVTDGWPGVEHWREVRRGLQVGDVFTFGSAYEVNPTYVVTSVVESTVTFESTQRRNPR